MSARPAFYAALALALLVLSACSAPGALTTDGNDWPTHNEYGGFYDSCGDLPPVIGDDC
jgi:hypothetical protein